VQRLPASRNYWRRLAIEFAQNMEAALDADE
jgi:hypothetical protein